MNSKPWEELPANSRFWCFSAGEPWSEDQDSLVHDHLDALCVTWAAHGVPVIAGFTTMERRIIALAVDEGDLAASGCSIDSRMKQLHALSEVLGIDFFGRMHIYVRSQLETNWNCVPLSEARRAQGEFLNTVATSKGDWLPIRPIAGSWLQPTRD